MLGSAPGRQHTTRGLEGERQLAQLIGITPALCGHLPIPQKPFPVFLPVLDVPAWTSPPLPTPILLPWHPPNLLFKILSLKGEQEPAHMVLAQLINAAGIDGTAQELIYFILRVQGILGTPAEGRGYGFTRCKSIAM